MERHAKPRVRTWPLHTIVFADESVAVLETGVLIGPPWVPVQPLATSDWESKWRGALSRTTSSQCFLLVLGRVVSACNRDRCIQAVSNLTAQDYSVTSIL